MTWQTYYYGTKLAFVSNVNNYLGSQDEIQGQHSNTGPSNRGDNPPAPPHQRTRQDVPTSTVPRTTPFVPSRRAFLQEAVPRGMLPSEGPAAADGAAFVGRGGAAGQDWQADVDLCGVLTTGSAPYGCGPGVAAAAATSVPCFRRPVAGFNAGGMAYGSPLPPPPPRRRPQSSPLFVGATFRDNTGNARAAGGVPSEAAGSSAAHARGAGVHNSGASGNGAAHVSAAGASTGGMAGSSAAHARGARGATGEPAGTSAVHARGAGDATGGAAGSSAAHARSAGGFTGGVAGSSAPHGRGARGATGEPAGTSAVHARGAGGATGGAAGSSAAHAGAAGGSTGASGARAACARGEAGGSLSDDEMLDRALSFVPRPPRFGAPRTTTGARVSRVARRPRAGTPRGTPSPSPTRRRRQSPSTSRGAGAIDGAEAATDGTTPADLLSTSSLGFASVRREITALKRELAMTNTQQRSTLNKMDSMAVMVENFVALVSSNRDIMLEMRDKMAAAPTLPPSQGSAGTPPAPDVEPSREAEDATWIVELRPVLVQWLQNNFANARCASEVWPTSATINEYLQNKITDIMGVTPNRAASMLQGKGRLPVRVKKNARTESPNEAVRTVAAKRKTPAYRFLHRGVSHFFQRIGIMAVGTFSSRMHNEEGLGTLRRVRGTRTKFEVVFSATEANDMLANDTFIVDAGCRAALMQAAHAVFDRMRMRNFSEPGPSRAGPRNVVCRLAHIALVSLKVRQHLQMRAAPVDEDGNAVLPAGLNVGHRDEWSKEMSTLSGLLAVQGDRAVNGLRLTDGEWPGRAMADLAPPPPVLGYSVSDDGRDREDGDADAGDNRDDGDDSDDEDDDATGADGAGGDDGAPDAWVAGTNEELPPGDGEEPPEGDEGEEELDARGHEDDDEQSEAYRAARAEERREFERAHAERRRRALARTAEMVSLRAAQQAAQRAIENDGVGGEDGGE